MYVTPSPGNHLSSFPVTAGSFTFSRIYKWNSYSMCTSFLACALLIVFFSSLFILLIWIFSLFGEPDQRFINFVYTFKEPALWAGLFFLLLFSHFVNSNFLVLTLFLFFGSFYLSSNVYFPGVFSCCEAVV